MDVLNEEIEVLESIFPEEFTRSSERHVQFNIRHDGEDGSPPEDNVVMQLDFRYPDDYPNVVPEFTLVPLEGEIDEQELSKLLTSTQSMAEQSLGEPSTFTVVSHLTDQLEELIHARTRRRQEERDKAEEVAIEAENQRLKGTPVTQVSFEEWKTKFLNEIKRIKDKEQDERLRGLGGREREDFKKFATRLTGRQLFEKNKLLEDAEEEGVVSVDFSQFAGSKEAREEEETSMVTFDDSD